MSVGVNIRPLWLHTCKNGYILTVTKSNQAMKVHMYSEHCLYQTILAFFLKKCKNHNETILRLSKIYIEGFPQ